MENIKQVAKYFISKKPVTHRKLQLLCYYTQAWYLARKNVPLMDTAFQAWIHGPTAPVLYAEYGIWENLTIASYGGEPPIFENPAITKYLDKIYRLYGKFSTEQLEEMAKGEYPYIRARRDIPASIPCYAIIAQNDMTDYYRKNADEILKKLQA